MGGLPGRLASGAAPPIKPLEGAGWCWGGHGGPLYLMGLGEVPHAGPGQAIDIIQEQAEEGQVEAWYAPLLVLKTIHKADVSRALYVYREKTTEKNN